MAFQHLQPCSKQGQHIVPLTWRTRPPQPHTQQQSCMHPTQQREMQYSPTSHGAVNCVVPPYAQAHGNTAAAFLVPFCLLHVLPSVPTRPTLGQHPTGRGRSLVVHCYCHLCHSCTYGMTRGALCAARGRHLTSCRPCSTAAPYCRSVLPLRTAALYHSRASRRSPAAPTPLLCRVHSSAPRWSLVQPCRTAAQPAATNCCGAGWGRGRGVSAHMTGGYTKQHLGCAPWPQLWSAMPPKPRMRAVPGRQSRGRGTKH